MNNIVEINTMFGDIKGQFSTSNHQMNFDFKGALLDAEGGCLINIEYSFPYSYELKYGKEQILQDIKHEVEDSINSKKIILN